VAPAFTAPSTGNTFFLNTSYMNFSSAESACAASGGHLASFLSQQEQAEVEQFYIRNGYLLPAFHRSVSASQLLSLVTGHRVTVSKKWPAEEHRVLQSVVPAEDCLCVIG
jgi:hypothetical protein